MPPVAGAAATRSLGTNMPNAAAPDFHRGSAAPESDGDAEDLAARAQPASMAAKNGSAISQPVRRMCLFPVYLREPYRATISGTGIKKGKVRRVIITPKPCSPERFKSVFKESGCPLYSDKRVWISLENFTWRL